MKKNYKSDFDIILRLKTCAGGVEQDAGWPDYDWVAKFYTSSRENLFIASNVGGSATNCFNDNGNIHIVFDNHGLDPGVLKVEFYAELPNNIYSDGSELLVSPQSLDVELVRGLGDCGTIADAQLLLPYIKGEKGDAGPIGPQGEKGEPFTYDDFTPQQIAALQKPATDAADNANAAAQNAATAASNANTAAENIQMELDKKADAMPDDVLSEAPEEEIEAVEPNLITDALRKTEQVLTREEQTQVLANLGHPDMRTFIDMWNNACGDYGRYNSKTGFFELNGLADIGYEEAMDIYIHSIQGLLNASTRDQIFFRCKLRTVLPINDVARVQKNWRQAFFASTRLEAVSFSPDPANMTNCVQMFCDCPKLKRIRPYLIMENCNGTQMFDRCLALEEVKIQSLKNSVSFADSPLLNLESIDYTVRNRPTHFTNQITIALHPYAYARVTDEIFTLAASKNITIASA